MNQQTFTTKLRSILTDNSGRRLVRGQTSGILDTTGLARLAIPSAGGRPTVFGHVERRKDTSYHVALLVDASGSMRHMANDGQRRYHAAFAAAHGIARGLHRAGCAVSAAAFNQYVRFWQVRELLAGSPRLAAEYTDMVQGVGNSQNYDATALELMRRHMAKQVESVKLIVVLSDGSPTGDIGSVLHAKYTAVGSWFEDQCEELPRVVSRCEAGGIAVIGVGIQSNDVRSYYKRSASVDNLKDLYPTVLAKVGAVIKRGH